MSKLWGRKYKITVVDNASGNGWEVSDLRCSFTIEKQLNEVSKISVVHIFNLSPATESNILKEANRVIIEAGYEAAETSQDSSGKKTVKELQYGKIYDGNIIQMIRTKDNNVDYDLCLVCLDGDEYLNYGLVMQTIKQFSSTPRDFVNILAEKSNYPVKTEKISNNLENKKLPRGKVFFGQPRDYLRDIAYENNGIFWIENNKLNLIKITDVLEDEAIVLTPETGLIGYPTQVDKGVQLRCLLDPRIKLNVLVKIDNSAVRRIKGQRGSLITPLDQDGEYHVIKITHIGDTRGNDWYTDVMAVNRAGVGAVAMLLDNPKQSPLGGGG